MNKLFQNSKFFTFDGKCSLDFGCVASQGGVYNITSGDGVFTQITGRTGDLYAPSSRLSNIEISYDCFIPGDRFFTEFPRLMEWLMTRDGYCILNDGARAGTFRRAVFVGGTNPTVNSNGGSFTVSFNCDPRVFTADGAQIQRLKPYYITNKEAKIYNPHLFTSKPQIYIKSAPAYTTLKVGDSRLVFRKAIASTSEDVSTWFCVDSEYMNCYQNGINMNDSVSVSNTDEPFPLLKSGDNLIQFGQEPFDGETVSTTTDIENLRIRPNFYTL